MISRVAVLPQPPLLVPELMGASKRSSEPMRQACLLAAHRLAEAAGHWIGIGPGEVAETVAPPARGSFREYGADVHVTLEDTVDGRGSAPSVSSPWPLPLPALIGGWLREQAGASTVRTELVPDTGSRGDPAWCRSRGRSIVDRLLDPDEQIGLLVLGDGSNRRGRGAPGGQDDRAEAFDAGAADALASADTTRLAELDPERARLLGVSGWAPWQVLARATAGGAWRGELLYTGAPFGVGYHVAVWDRA